MSIPCLHGPRVGRHKSCLLVRSVDEEAALRSQAGSPPQRGTSAGRDLDGEFDPGSGRTLAARLTHASRARTRACPGDSGERVSNTWVTHPWYQDSPRKLGLIPDGPTALRGGWKR